MFKPEEVEGKTELEIARMIEALPKEEVNAAVLEFQKQTRAGKKPVKITFEAEGHAPMTIETPAVIMICERIYPNGLPGPDLRIYGDDPSVRTLLAIMHDMIDKKMGAGSMEQAKKRLETLHMAKVV